MTFFILNRYWCCYVYVNFPWEWTIHVLYFYGVIAILRPVFLFTFASHLFTHTSFRAIRKLNCEWWDRFRTFHWDFASYFEETESDCINRKILNEESTNGRIDGFVTATDCTAIALLQVQVLIYPDAKVPRKFSPVIEMIVIESTSNRLIVSLGRITD